jgi:hypothetical protein
MLLTIFVDRFGKIGRKVLQQCPVLPFSRLEITLSVVMSKGGAYVELQSSQQGPLGVDAIIYAQFSRIIL